MKKYIPALTLLMVFALQVSAQTTAFNYQGRLTEGGNPANGAYQMQFKLFDALAGGSQIGSTLSDINVTVTNGIFSTKLDFGANALSGANRWLEIAVRHSSSEFYTTLAPREQIGSSPYAVRTLSAASADNALNLGGIPASEYVTTSSVSSAFIRNSIFQQSAAFNISGSGFFGGSVGIGTTNPGSGLEIRGAGFGAQQRITDSISGNSLVLQSGTGNGMKVTGYNYSSNAAVPIHLGTDGANTIINGAGGNVSIGTTSPTARLTIVGEGLNGYSLGVSSNVGIGGFVTQSRDKGGMVKGMLFVNGDASIIRCYNGTNGASTGNCGFSVTRINSGLYAVDFNFQIEDRFLSVSVKNNNNFGIYPDAGVSFGEINPNDNVFVYTYQVGAGPSDRPFMLIVY